MRRTGTALLALMGVWILATSPSLLQYGVLWLASWSIPESGISKRHLILGTGAIALPFLLAIAIGLFLILMRDSLGRRLFPDSDPQLAPDAVTVLIVGIVLLGIFMSVSSLRGLVSTITSSISNLLRERGTDVGAAVFARQQFWFLIPQVLADLVELAVGLFLVLRPRTVSRWAMAQQEPDA